MQNLSIKMWSSKVALNLGIKDFEDQITWTRDIRKTKFDLLGFSASPFILTHYVTKYPYFLFMLGLSDVESIARHRIDEGGWDISSWNLDELLLDVIWMR